MFLPYRQSRDSAHLFRSHSLARTQARPHPAAGSGESLADGQPQLKELWEEEMHAEGQPAASAMLFENLSIVIH